MDTDAARRARQKTFKADLAEAYTDEEACPPEWVDLLDGTTKEKALIRAEIDDETSRFASEPDIKRALERRARFEQKIRERIIELNRNVTRLNLIAPNSRFTRGTLVADEVLKPLFRTTRTQR